MMIDERARELKTLHPTNDAIEEKVDSFHEKPKACIDETAIPVDVLEEEARMKEDDDEDDFDGWNVELKDSDDNDSGLVAKPNDVPITEPRKTLMETLKGATADGEFNPALQVTLSIAPIFQIDRPYKLKYNNISDEEFREMFWASYEHEITAICVDYQSGGLAFITGYQSFLHGIETKSFYLSAADIDKYDIRFTPYCTYAEAVEEYEYKNSKLKEEEKEN